VQAEPIRGGLDFKLVRDKKGNLTCNAAKSFASWPIWLEERDEVRSSMDKLMMVVKG
jgi:hypothetical protein